MNKYIATLLGLVIAALCAWMLPLLSASAESKTLTLDEAGKLGMKVELVTPKPRVIYATLRFAEVPQEAQLVLQNGKGEWVANTSMAFTDNACSAWLAEEYVGKSYFLVTPKLSDTTYHIPLR
ncbi:MAG: hypothetical protein U0935_25165 [Pirellulales bacterium]